MSAPDDAKEPETAESEDEEQEEGDESDVVAAAEPSVRDDFRAAVKRRWRRWVAITSRLEDARPLSLLRVLVCLALVLDLLQVARLGLVSDLFKLAARGGIANSGDEWAFLSKMSPDHGGEIAWAIAIVSLALASAGVFARPMMLIGAFADGQLGHVFQIGDRAIDRLLRTVLLILVFSRCDARYALTGKRANRIPAWSSDTIKVFLVIIYSAAVISKVMQQPGWLATSGMPVLYRVMCDPMSAHIDPVAALPWWPVLRVLGWGTIALEASSFLMLTKYARYWGVAAAAMHIGIFLTMDLGVFSWGMLAMYPLLFAPWIEKLDDKEAAPAV